MKEKVDLEQACQTAASRAGCVMLKSRPPHCRNGEKVPMLHEFDMSDLEDANSSNMVFIN